VAQGEPGGIGPTQGVTHVRPIERPPVEAEPGPGAPGVVTNGTAIALFVIAMWRGSERGGDLGSILLIAAGWFILLLAWLLWTVAATGAGTIGTRHLVRWMLAPSLFAVAFALSSAATPWRRASG
jgi:hypothetical protein